jgi:hypothetical protein
MKTHNNTKTTITNLDLHNFYFPINTLIKNIEHLDLTIIIKTQILTYDFIIKYILNEQYQKMAEEKTIDMYDITNHQPHIDINELRQKIKNTN